MKEKYFNLMKWIISSTYLAMKIRANERGFLPTRQFCDEKERCQLVHYLFHTFSKPGSSCRSWVQPQWKLKNDLVKNLKKNVLFWKLKNILKSGERLASFFLFKDKFPEYILFGTIDQYSCDKCNLYNVGGTERFQ